MCRPARCHTCSNTTWTGCGAHIDQVMQRIPRDERCTCDEQDRRTGLAAKLMQLLRP